MQCPIPCPTVAQAHDDMVTLRAHLVEGYQCFDAWLAMSDLVQDPQQRCDCLERAAVLVPENQDLLERYLQALLVVQPGNKAAQARLSEIKTMRLVAGVKTVHFHEQQRARLLGDILVESGALSATELRDILRVQNNGTPITSDRRLGQLLLRNAMITPAKLAHALIVQQQERSRLRIAPQVFGEFLVEHGQITPQQLELALAEQLRLDQRGQRLSLGQILVRLKMVSASIIEQNAHEHQLAFWAKYGN